MFYETWEVKNTSCCLEEKILSSNCRFRESVPSSASSLVEFPKEVFLVPRVDPVFSSNSLKNLTDYKQITKTKQAEYYKRKK